MSGGARTELGMALASTAVVLTGVTAFLLWVVASGPSPLNLAPEPSTSATPAWAGEVVYGLLAGVPALGAIVVASSVLGGVPRAPPPSPAAERA